MKPHDQRIFDSVGTLARYPPPVHIADLTEAQQRVLGCLLEKRFTTPDQYPLTLNGLRLACNQATNRDPVVDYDERTVREAADRLTQYGVARMVSGHSSRAIKYRHLAEEAFGLDSEQLAVLCVLLLRGPQTPGELKQRTERMRAFSSLDGVDEVLRTLIEKGYVSRVDRQPGQKEDRFRQLLGGHDGAGSPAASAAGQSTSPAAADRDGLEARVGALEEQVARLEALEQEVARLRSDLRELLE